jgi:hypothetical protein
MIKKYYIETSIPSSYYETRTNVRVLAMPEWTKQWWHLQKSDGFVQTGAPVIVELLEAPDPKKENCLRLIKNLPVLEYTEEIDEIVNVYIKHKIMPNESMGDAAHLALASFYKCDFLVTWNCKHIANANKFDHITRINSILGLFNPKLVTPFQLLNNNTGG